MQSNVFQAYLAFSLAMLQSRSTDYRNAKSFLRLFCYTLIRANQPTGIRENFFSQFSQKDYFLTIALTNQIIASTFAIPESCEQCDEERSDHLFADCVSREQECEIRQVVW